jgi:hypothetical protein
MTFKDITITLTSDFSAEALQARREWNHVFQILKENNYQPRLLCPTRFSVLQRQITCANKNNFKN